MHMSIRWYKVMLYWPIPIPVVSWYSLPEIGQGHLKTQANSLERKASRDIYWLSNLFCRFLGVQSHYWGLCLLIVYSIFTRTRRIHAHDIPNHSKQDCFCSERDRKPTIRTMALRNNSKLASHSALRLWLRIVSVYHENTAHREISAA